MRKLYVIERRRVLSDQTYVVQWLAANNPYPQWTSEQDKALRLDFSNARGQVRVCEDAAYDFSYHDLSYRLLTTCQCNPQFHWCDPVREAAPAVLKALEMVLQLAEAYLRHAPSSPNNAKLETARAAIRAARREKS